MHVFREQGPSNHTVLLLKLEVCAFVWPNSKWFIDGYFNDAYNYVEDPSQSINNQAANENFEKLLQHDW